MKMSDFVLRYTYPSTDADEQATRVARTFELRAGSVESALEIARDKAVTLSNDPSLSDFCLICPGGEEIPIDISGVERADTKKLADLLIGR